MSPEDRNRESGTTDEDSGPPESPVFRMLRGRCVVSVQFVHDYFQLHFDEGRVTVNSPTTLLSGERQFSHGSSGWCDALGGFVGDVVSDVLVEPDQALVIAMESGRRLTISLRAVDQATPESAVIDDGQGTVIVVS